MKLLFDNNVSVLLPGAVEPFFSGSKHAADLGFDQVTDHKVGHYDKENGFANVAKEKSFYHLAMSAGQPPKMVWLTIGNCTNCALMASVVEAVKAIRQFIGGDKDLLVLP